MKGKSAKSKGTGIGPKNKTPSLIQIFQAVAAIVALPLALFALTNNVFGNPVITLTVALIMAIIVSFYVGYVWNANALTIIIAWLILVVAALAVFVILPKTITVEGKILDTAEDPIRHEKVVLVDVDGIARETYTDEAGHYQFKNVPNDAYVIKVRDSEVGGKAGGILVRIMITDLTLSQPTPAPTAMDTPTLTPTLTPTPRTIVDVENLTGWRANFDNSMGNGSSNGMSLVSGRTGSAVEISYDLGNAGYVVITKGIDPTLLFGTTGISFFYKGNGAANTIEFKLILRYPDDNEDTTYGILWNKKTNTDGNWEQLNVPYSDFACWWPSAGCLKHGNKIDLIAVDRLDFAISNKAGDEVGSGRVAFDDVLGIQP